MITTERNPKTITFRDKEYKLLGSSKDTRVLLCVGENLEKREGMDWILDHNKVTKEAVLYTRKK